MPSADPRAQLLNGTHPAYHNATFLLLTARASTDGACILTRAVPLSA